jgi:hypothetical protein
MFSYCFFARGVATEGHHIVVMTARARLMVAVIWAGVAPGLFQYRISA